MGVIAPFALSTLTLMIAGCGADGATDDAGSGAQIFVASISDFTGYTTWKSFQYDNPVATTDGLTHTAGHRVVYLNHIPPTGSKTFPVGTIIVKTIQPGTANEQIFAMSKRGGGYNPAAPGWEWYELVVGDPDTAPMWKWFGIEPPAGENYTGSPSGTCNDCHGAVTDNDSVQSTQLLLTNF